MGEVARPAGRRGARHRAIVLSAGRGVRRLPASGMERGTVCAWNRAAMSGSGPAGDPGAMLAEEQELSVPRSGLRSWASVAGGELSQWESNRGVKTLGACVRGDARLAEQGFLRMQTAISDVKTRDFGRSEPREAGAAVGPRTASAVRRLWLARAVAVAFAWTSGAVSAADAPAAQQPQAASGATYPFEEEVPPIGENNLLSEEQIRYCLAQIIRIEATRPLLNRYRPEQVDYFNHAVADYNSRCGRYRYEGDAHDAAKGLVEENRAQVERDARDAYAKRFPPQKKTARKPVSPAAPQAKTEPQVSASAPVAEELAVAVEQPVSATPSASPAKPAETSTPVPAPQPKAAQQASTPPAAAGEPVFLVDLSATATQPSAPTQRAEPSKPVPPPSQVQQQAAATAPPAAAPRPAEIAQAVAAPARSEAKSAEPSKPVPPSSQAQQQAAAAIPPPAAPRPAEVAQPAAAPPPSTEAKTTEASKPAPAQPEPERIAAVQSPAGVPAPPVDVAHAAPATTQPATAPSTQPQSAVQPSSSFTPAPKPPAAASERAAEALPPEGGTKPAQPSKPAPAASQTTTEQQAVMQAPAPEAAQAPGPLPSGPETKAAGPTAPPAAVPTQAGQAATQAPAAGTQPAAAPTSPPPAAPPTTLARAETKPERSADAVLAQFTEAVQRAGSQVLDERYYPAAARDKGWEGTSQIEVRFAAGGYIQSIRLAQSSGHPPLDDTALDLARNIRFPDEPAELQSRDFAVRFPVVFRLQKSQ